MVAHAPSGMYKCPVCGNIIAHHRGNEFEPCSHCDSSDWVIIEKDPDYLEYVQHSSTVQHS